MTYHVETRRGEAVAICSDLFDALRLSRRYTRTRGGPNVLRVRNVTSGAIVGVALRAGESGKAHMLAAARENQANGCAAYRAPKRERPQCPEGDGPHRWACVGLGWACETCGQAGHAKPGALGLRVDPLWCTVCGKAATGATYSRGFDKGYVPMCDACRDWDKGAA